MGNAPPPPLGAALLLRATGSPSSGLRIRSFGGDEATTRLKNDDGFTTLALASPALADSWITHLAVGEASPILCPRTPRPGLHRQWRLRWLPVARQQVPLRILETKRVTANGCIGVYLSTDTKYY